MERKNEKNEFEIFDEIYANLWEQTKLEKEFLEAQIEKQNGLLSIHMEKEPLKIFRKSYFAWQEEKEDLEAELREFVLEQNKVLEELKKQERK